MFRFTKSKTMVFPREIIVGHKTLEQCSELCGRISKGQNALVIVDKDTKKQHPEHIIDKNVAEYIEEVKESQYKGFILKELEWTGKDDNITLSSDRFRKHVKSNGRNVPTTPQIRDQFGKICENLEEMEGEFAKKIVKWLSLRNRRNVIKSEKGTGWLNNPRLQRDGRLPAGQSGTTNTHRYKHRVVNRVNLI